MLKQIIIASFCIILALGTTGVDVSQPMSQDTTNCFKSNGQSFLIARGYCSYGGIDPNAKTTLQNAQASGLITDTYLFPCMGNVSPQQQAQDIVNNLGSLAGTYWIDVENNPSAGCQWSTSDFSANCSFLGQLVQALQGQGVNVGVYSNYYQWQTIMGSASSCADFTNLPLWYASYDNQQSFSGFSSFGGWTDPAMKQYQGDVSLCSAGVDMNWY